MRPTTLEDFLGQEHLRSEEHTSELQSQSNLVCRLLLEKKKAQVVTSQVRIKNTRLHPAIYSPQQYRVAYLGNSDIRPLPHFYVLPDGDFLALSDIRPHH